MKNLENDIREYLTERGWTNMRPGDLAKSISIESAELLELFQWSNESVEELKDDEEKMYKIRRELADVLIYALDMTVLLDLDTEQIIREKLSYVKEKFPSDLMKKDAKEEDTSKNDSHYLRIKKQYRKEGRQ